MKILVNCYACSPYKGSEPGMGWNFIQSLASSHELHVITESKFQEDLEKYFAIYPEKRNNIIFYFIQKNRHKRLRKIWPPSYYWFYKQWQKKAFKKAVELDREYNFDIVHQLNMIGYREPGYLWKLNKPFVWGPIGGFHITPWKMLPSMGLRGGIYYFFRNIINLLQMYLSLRVRKAIRHSDVLISATHTDSLAIKKIWDRQSHIIPEVGIIATGTNAYSPRRNKKLKICWSGMHVPGKSLNLLLDALSILKNESIETHILGEGTCTNSWKKKSHELNLPNITFYGWVSRDEAVRIMGECNVFVITSLADATSTVILEALSYGLPVVALDHCGFANVLNENCGIKIPIISQKQVIRDIANALKNIDSSQEYQLSLSAGAIQRAQDFTWEAKAIEINSLYQQALKTD